MRIGRIVEVKNSGQGVEKAFGQAKKKLPKGSDKFSSIDHVCEVSAIGTSVDIPEDGVAVVPLTDNYEEDVNETSVFVSRSVVQSRSVFQDLSCRLPHGAVSVEDFIISRDYPVKRTEYEEEISYDILANGYKVKNVRSFEEADECSRVLSSLSDGVISIRKIMGDPETSDFIRYEPDYPEQVEVNVQWNVRIPLDSEISSWMFYF